MLQVYIEHAVQRYNPQVIVLDGFLKAHGVLVPVLQVYRKGRILISCTSYKASSIFNTADAESMPAVHDTQGRLVRGKDDFNMASWEWTDYVMFLTAGGFPNPYRSGYECSKRALLLWWWKYEVSKDADRIIEESD